MTPQNIAIVIAPNLIWSPNEDSNTIGMNMNVANLHSIIVDSLVTFADWFFQGEMDFYVTLSRDNVGFLNGHEGADAPTQDIKRTQSNDSLSDHNSPPQGSPKPAVRSRKKPAAPHPPGYNKDRDDKSSGDDKAKDKPRSSGEDKAKDKSKSSGDDKAKDKGKPSPAKHKEDTSSKNMEEPKEKTLEQKPPPPSETKKASEKHSEVREAKKDEGETQTSASTSIKPSVPPPAVPTTPPSNAVAPTSIVSPPPVPAVAPVVTSPTAPSVTSPLASSVASPPAPSEEPKSLPAMTDSEGKRPDIGFEGFKHVEPWKPLETHFPAHFPSVEKKPGDLDKRTSKSGEDLRKLRSNEMATYATLDRKKPPRPTPAPRVSLEASGAAGESKPAIPERPAALQRPLSSSFRIVRPPLDSSPSEGEVRTLERAHVFSLDKQQVSYIQVSSDKVPTDKKSERERRESGEKPEKPKKPDSLVGQSGHHRAASEGSIIDTGFSTTERRPPRPTPPPPPLASPVKTKESTDL
uniref:Rho GTPase-activating protein 92B n=2 Tax=Lygus hesperus TaxID=30085 RepID=A0A0A9W9T3_LYGHE